MFRFSVDCTVQSFDVLFPVSLHLMAAKARMWMRVVVLVAMVDRLRWFSRQLLLMDGQQR